MTTEKTKDKAPKEPKRGVGTVVREAIRAGKTNEGALEAARAEFPDANTSLASVNWYRNQMRQEDPAIPSARDLKKAAKEADEKAKKSAEAAAKKAEPAPKGAGKDALA